MKTLKFDTLYCEVCKNHQPFSERKSESANGDLFVDVCCDVCDYVIATSGPFQNPSVACPNCETLLQEWNGKEYCPTCLLDKADA